MKLNIKKPLPVSLTNVGDSQSIAHASKRLGLARKR
jgi:hypothetical protein